MSGTIIFLTSHIELAQVSILSFFVKYKDYSIPFWKIKGSEDQNHFAEPKLFGTSLIFLEIQGLKKNC
jgi:hypothetical protein